MHYYQHHIGDFLKDTANLTNEQRAVYLMMLWKYYTDEKPITESCEDLAFAMRSDEKTVQLLLRHFFVKQDDGWHQLRCDREIADYHGKSEKAKKSANARWTNAKAMRTHTESNADATKSDANQEPITNNQYSVPKGTDGKPSTDEIIFGYGVPLLTNAGTSDKQARSFLGGLRKSHGDAALVNALRDCIREKPMQPLEWLAATLPPRGARPSLNRQESIEARNRAVVERLLKKEAASAGL